MQIEILLGKLDKFDEILVVVAEEANEYEDDESWNVLFQIAVNDNFFKAVDV